ncbi:MAG: hypothetical protein ACQEXQ_17365 [Bacillota bacterium]
MSQHSALHPNVPGLRLPAIKSLSNPVGCGIKGRSSESNTCNLAKCALSAKLARQMRMLVITVKVNVLETMANP